MKDFTVEINPSNRIITGINRLRKEDPNLATLTLKQLFDSSMLQSNLPISNKDFVKRSFTLIDLVIENSLKSRDQENLNSSEPVIENIKRNE